MSARHSLAKIKVPPLAKIRVERMLRSLNDLKPVEDPWLIPNAMLPLMVPKQHDTFPVRYRICYGGRGAARSWTFARCLLVRALAQKQLILCAREFQNSISESIHRLLCDQMKMLDIDDCFDVQKTTIIANNGSEFIFAGIRNNVSKIKSMEGINICYVEEAEKISEDSWETLQPTIRRSGSEIWAAFNPDLKTDPTYKMFVLNPPKDAIVLRTTFRDNPWFPEVLRTNMEYMQRVDIDAYHHVWEGGCRSHSEAQILKGKVIVEAFEPGSDWDGPYQGADFGFSKDPATLVRCWIHGRRLYVEYEAYAIGCDIDRLPQLYDTIPNARKYTTRGDSARPDTVSYLQQHGYENMTSVAKWAGSIDDGVAHLRSYEAVVIHPRCEHTIEESRLYSFKVDRLSGDVLPDIEDKHNHCMDGIRYALQPVIQGAGADEYMKWLRTQVAVVTQAEKKDRKEDSLYHHVDYIKLNGAK